MKYGLTLPKGEVCGDARILAELGCLGWHPPFVILSASEGSRAMGNEILRWRSG